MLERIQRAKFHNYLRTALLTLVMFLLMLTLGYIFMGWGGLIWGAVLAGASLFLGARIPASMIMRMYRARPLYPHEAPYLHQVVKQLSEKARLAQQPQLYYIPSHQLNAFATGRKHDPAIALTYGILTQLNLRELTGVLAHEMSHIVHQDMRLQGLIQVIGRLVRFFSLFGQFLLILNFPLLLSGAQTISWVAILLLIFGPILTTILMTAVSRTREFDADLEAARLTGDPNSLADALVKLHRINGNNRLMQALPKWLSTHPDTEERVSRLRALAPRYQPRIHWPEIEWLQNYSPFLRKTPWQFWR